MGFIEKSKWLMKIKDGLGLHILIMSDIVKKESTKEYIIRNRAEGYMNAREEIREHSNKAITSGNETESSKFFPSNIGSQIAFFEHEGG